MIVARFLRRETVRVGNRIRLMSTRDCYPAGPRGPAGHLVGDGIKASWHQRHHGIEKGIICEGASRSTLMQYKLLDTVVLNTDLPKHGLKKGDLGAVVHTYEPDGLEVEFVSASGRTQALVTLKVGDVRLVLNTDLVAVRPLPKSA